MYRYRGKYKITKKVKRGARIKSEWGGGKKLLFFSISLEVPFNFIKFTFIFYCDKNREEEKEPRHKTMRHFHKKIYLAKATMVEGNNNCLIEMEYFQCIVSCSL